MSFPFKNGDFHSYVSLPEGTYSIANISPYIPTDFSGQPSAVGALGTATVAGCLLFRPYKGHGEKHTEDVAAPVWIVSKDHLNV